MAACTCILSTFLCLSKSKEPSFEVDSWRKPPVNCNQYKLVYNNQQLLIQSAQGLDKWIRENDEMVRVAPLFCGGSSFLAVLLNRTLSGIAPVADASSAQSRADVLALVLAATVVLTGLIWISVRPKELMSVQLSGIKCVRLDRSLPSDVAAEIMWAWEAVKEGACCKALVIVYRGQCVLQAGLAAESDDTREEAVTVDSATFVKGSLCQGLWASEKQSYLANLSLYPGRFELGFLPPNTQAVILQPLGDEGVMVIAGDTVRGFGPTDQAWIASIAEKLDATLGKCTLSTLGNAEGSNVLV